MQVRGKPTEAANTLRTSLAVLDSAGLSPDDLRVSLGLGTVRVAARMDFTAQDAVSEAIRSLRQHGLSVLILTAPDDIKRAVDAFGTPESTLELMRLLKRQFDPRSVLNPGRVIPEL